MNRLKSSMLIMLAVAMAAGVAIIPTKSAEAQGSAALSIAPRKNYTVEPGKEINDTLLIRNIDREQELNLSLRVVDFTFNDDGGTPKLMIGENEPETPWSLRSLMEVQRNVTIAPGGSESIPITVNIPEDRKAGSYYSAIIYSSSAAEGGNVGLSASGVTLVFANIPGEVDEKLTLEKLGAYDSAVKKYKFFNIEMPKRIGYTLKNEGNVAEAPVGSMTIKNIFGQEKTINDINPNRSLALIGQTRTFESCIILAKEQVDFDGSRSEATTCADAGLWPGFYTVELRGFYGWNGNNTQEVIGKAYFIYTPWWFIAAVLVALAFIGYHVWKMVRYFRYGKKGGTKTFVPRSRK